MAKVDSFQWMHENKLYSPIVDALGEKFLQCLCIDIFPRHRPGQSAIGTWQPLCGTIAFFPYGIHQKFRLWTQFLYHRQVICPILVNPLKDKPILTAWGDNRWPIENRFPKLLQHSPTACPLCHQTSLWFHWRGECMKLREQNKLRYANSVVRLMCILCKSVFCIETFI